MTRAEITFSVTDTAWHQRVVREDGVPAAVLPDLVRFFTTNAEYDDLARRFTAWSAAAHRPALTAGARRVMFGFRYQVDVTAGCVDVTVYRVQRGDVRLCGLASVQVFHAVVGSAA